MDKINEPIKYTSEFETEVKLFSSPKVVKKKRTADILLAQAAFCVVLFTLMVLLKSFLPDIYDNIAGYLEEFIL